MKEAKPAPKKNKRTMHGKWNDIATELDVPEPPMPNHDHKKPAGPGPHNAAPMRKGMLGEKPETWTPPSLGKKPMLGENPNA